MPKKRPSRSRETVVVAMAWCRGLATLLVLALHPFFAEASTADTLAAVVHEHSKMGAQCLAILSDSKMAPFVTKDMSTYNIKIDKELREGLMPKVGQFSQHYLIVVNKLESAEEFLDTYGKHLKKKGAFYSIIARSATVQEVERVFKGSEFLRKILNIVIISERLMPDAPIAYAKPICDDAEPEVVAIWSARGMIKKPGTNGLFPKDVLSDLSCKHFKAASFEFPPFINVKENEDGARVYTGIEPEIFYAIAAKLGFTYTIRPPRVCCKWGWPIQNGTNFTGVTGDIVNEWSDIAWAQLFFVPYRKKFMDYTHFYDIDSACFMVKKPDAISKFTALTRPLFPEVWAATGLVCLICLGFVGIYGAFFPWAENGPADLMFFLLGSVLDVSHPCTWNLRSLGIRVFFVFFTLSFFTLTIGYRQALMSTLSVPKIPAPIDTMKELAESDMGVSSLYKHNLGTEGENPHTLAIVAKYREHNRDFAGALKNASEGSLAICESRQNLVYTMRKEFTNNYGETDMHIMRECFNAYRVGFIMPKDSIFTDKFGMIIQHLQEGGFINKWIADEMEKVAKLAIHAGGVKPPEPWTLDKLQSAFALFGLCVVISTMFFAIESFV